MTAGPTPPMNSRVPLALQDIFTKAQQGEDVAPPRGLGFRVFKHKWSKKETGKAKPRIPQALKNIFLASQRGDDVRLAPKKGLGSKVFDQSFDNTSVTSDSTYETAAESSRKAIKNRKKNQKKNSVCIYETLKLVL
jgi:hypothetical protein